MSTLLDAKEERLLGSKIRIRAAVIDEEHVWMLDEFSCGNEVIDVFLREQALYSRRETTHIFIDEEENRIAAFASLSCSALPVMSHDIYNDFIPSVELTYFAVDTRYQKLHMTEDPEDGYFSDSILNLAIDIVYDMAEQDCGAVYITLHATPDGYRLYQRNAFRDLAEDFILQRQSIYLEGCRPMYYRLYP